MKLRLLFIIGCAIGLFSHQVTRAMGAIGDLAGTAIADSLGDAFGDAAGSIGDSVADSLKGLSDVEGSLGKALSDLPQEELTSVFKAAANDLKNEIGSMAKLEGTAGEAGAPFERFS